MSKIWHFSDKFYQHLSLYCGSVRIKLQVGPGYWFMRELALCIMFPKFTDNLAYNYLFKNTQP